MKAQTTFASRLEDALVARGMKQLDLAQLVGVTPPTVHRWLNGTKPGKPTLEHVAARLGVPYGWLAEGKEGVPLNPLRRAREAAGMDIRDLAKATGYQIGVLQAVENGARASERMLEKIAEVLPLNVAEIMNESETPLVISETGMDGTYGAKPTLKLPPGVIGRLVPVYSFAQAGQYNLLSLDEAWTGESTLAQDVTDRDAFGLRNSGHSMSPVINDGDILIVTPSYSPRLGDTVAVRTIDGQVFCKVWQGEKNGEIILHSHNSEFPDLQIARGNVAYIYPIDQVNKRLRRP